MRRSNKSIDGEEVLNPSHQKVPSRQFDKLTWNWCKKLIQNKSKRTTRGWVGTKSVRNHVWRLLRLLPLSSSCLSDHSNHEINGSLSHHPLPSRTQQVHIHHYCKIISLPLLGIIDWPSWEFPFIWIHVSCNISIDRCSLVISYIAILDIVVMIY